MPHGYLSIKSHAWLWVLHICKNHAFIIIIMEWALFEKIKDQSCNSKNRKSGEMANHVVETYKILPCHMVNIYSTQHLTWLWQQFVHIYHQNMHLRHWRCVLCCCSKYPCIDIPSPELYQRNFNEITTINFYMYQLIAHFTVHVRHPFNENK